MVLLFFFQRCQHDMQLCKAAATKRDKMPEESRRQVITEIIPTTQKRAAGKVIPEMKCVYCEHAFHDSKRL